MDFEKLNPTREIVPVKNYSTKPISEPMDDASIFRRFYDRFKTWEELRARDYSC